MQTKAETSETTLKMIRFSGVTIHRIENGLDFLAGNSAAICAHQAFVLNPDLRPNLRNDTAIIRAFPCSACQDEGNCSVCRTL